jgi:hypothetical protein
MKKLSFTILFLLGSIIFNSNLIAQNTNFDQITLAEIQSANLSNYKIDASPNIHNQIPSGTILLYKTNENRYGKLLIKHYGDPLIIKWKTYNSNGSVYSQGDKLAIGGSHLCDLDVGRHTKLSPDFHYEWETDSEAYFSPWHGAKFVIYYPH